MLQKGLEWGCGEVGVGKFCFISNGEGFLRIIEGIGFLYLVYLELLEIGGLRKIGGDGR